MIAIFGILLLLLFLLGFRQPIVLVLIGLTAYVHFVWGDGK